MADREGDIYALFAQAAAHPEVGVLVRARHNRRTAEGIDLDKTLKDCPLAGYLQVTVPRRPGASAREVQLEVRCSAVRIKAPKSSKGPDLNLWLIEARQVKGTGQLIKWRLLTNLPVENLAAAVEKIEWYKVRWQIEEYHRVLKSGCQAQGRQLETEQRLMNALMVDLVVAWRVLELSRASRQEEERLKDYFTSEEIEVIAVYRKEIGKPAAELTLRQTVRTVAAMGGFLGRKGDGEPGAMTLWRGLEMLHQLVAGWRLAKRCG